MKALVYKIIKIASVLISSFNALLFLAMRCCWSGISKTLGYEKSHSELILHLPEIIFGVMVIVAIANLVLYFVMKKEKKLWACIFLGVDVALLIGNIVIIALGAIDYIRFVWVELLKSLLVVAIVLILVFLIFVYPKTKLKDSKVFKLSSLAVILVVSIITFFNVGINRFTSRSVVYAVEDDYQIVFSTSTNSLGWVEIDGKKYHDLNAGSQKSFTRIHKIEVPMSVLDKAKAYSIHTQKVLYRGPFGGIMGKELSENYNFRPVDTSDGIDYFSLADIHMELDGSVKVADYAKDKEFLVLAGDIISMMDTFDDANYVNVISHALTKGEIPVVYARGNHEVKGKYSEEFHKFVGSKDGDFYFNFYLGGIYGLVLDIGEDHDDDWWEYYGTAAYDVYRQEQIDFLKEEIEIKEYEKYDYKMVVCHIPIVFVNYRKNHTYVKDEFTKLLNEMDIDIALGGHQHDLLVFEPGVVEPNTKLKYNPDYKKGTYSGYLTDFNFPNLLISKRGLTQTDDADLTLNTQIGLNIKVDLVNNKQICTYLNGQGNKVNIVNPFAEKDYGEEIVIDLKTKKFE